MPSQQIFQRKCSAQLQIEEYLFAHQSFCIFDSIIVDHFYPGLWLAGHALEYL